MHRTWAAPLVNILFLSHYFPPEINAPASRTSEHCRRWVAAGHAVTVVTCAPNHPRGEVYPGYRNHLFARERRDGIDIIRVWTWLAANRGFGGRTLNYLCFMLACIVAIPWLPRADVVISTSPQFFNGLAGWFVSRAKRAPWVLEIRDLWPESILAVGAITNPAMIGVLRWLERFAYRKAEHIVAVTDAFKTYMTDIGVPADKVSVIKNGVDTQLFRRDVDAGDLRRELGLDGKHVAAYFGTHGMAHHLETVLEAAALTRDQKDLVWLLAGDGAERDRLVRMRAAQALDNVVMLGQQDKARMPALWSLADVSLVVLRRSSLFLSVIPSKIFEAMGTATPIVLGVDGEARGIVEAAGAGEFVVPEDAAALAATVTGLMQDPARRATMGASGYTYVREHFDREGLAARFLALLQSLVTTNREGRR